MLAAVSAAVDTYPLMDNFLQERVKLMKYCIVTKLLESSQHIYWPVVLVNKCILFLMYRCHICQLCIGWENVLVYALVENIR